MCYLCRESKRRKLGDAAADALFAPKDESKYDHEATLEPYLVDHDSKPAARLRPHRCLAAQALLRQGLWKERGECIRAMLNEYLGHVPYLIEQIVTDALYEPAAVFTLHIGEPRPLDRRPPPQTWYSGSSFELEPEFYDEQSGRLVLPTSSPTMHNGGLGPQLGWTENQMTGWSAVVSDCHSSVKHGLDEFIWNYKELLRPGDLIHLSPPDHHYGWAKHLVVWDGVRADQWACVKPYLAVLQAYDVTTSPFTGQVEVSTFEGSELSDTQREILGYTTPTLVGGFPLDHWNAAFKLLYPLISTNIPETLTLPLTVPQQQQILGTVRSSQDHVSIGESTGNDDQQQKVYIYQAEVTLGCSTLCATRTYRLFIYYLASTIGLNDTRRIQRHFEEAVRRTVITVSTPESFNRPLIYWTNHWPLHDNPLPSDLILVVWNLGDHLGP